MEIFYSNDLDCAFYDEKSPFELSEPATKTKLTVNHLVKLSGQIWIETVRKVIHMLWSETSTADDVRNNMQMLFVTILLIGINSGSKYVSYHKPRHETTLEYISNTLNSPLK